MVSEARGKQCLGLLAMGIGAIGIISALFFWYEAAHTARLMGAYSRDLAGIAGASAFLSGFSLLGEVGMSLRPGRSFIGIKPVMLLAVTSISLLSVTVALLIYSANASINICLLPPALCP